LKSNIEKSHCHVNCQVGGLIFMAAPIPAPRHRTQKQFLRRPNSFSNHRVIFDPIRATTDDAPALCSWKQQDDSIGTPPFERANHTAIIVDSKLYIYGGHDYAGTPLNDVVIYDIERTCWIHSSFRRTLPRKGKPHDRHAKQMNPALQACPQPPRRCKHTAVYYQGHMVVMGGCPSETEGEIYFLDLAAMNWYRFIPTNPPPEAIVPRSHHSASIWNSSMVIFGGINGETALDSLIIFDFQKFRWTVLKHGLPMVYAHTSFVKGDILFIVGGWRENCSHFLAVSLVDGSKVIASNYLPKFDIDVGLAASCYDAEYDRLYILGGYSINSDVEEGCTDRLHIIDLKQKTVTDVFSALIANCPSPRCGHVMALYNDNLFVFGGCNRLPLLNGDWVFCDFSNAVWQFKTPPAGFDLTRLREMFQEREAPGHSLARLRSHPSDA
jgi:hypothetical protein